MTLTSEALQEITFPADDDYSNPANYRNGERFWWHAQIAKELARLDAQGFPAACVAAIASNIRCGVGDTAKNLSMMLTWGEVERAEALHDFEPDTWVKLSPADLTVQRDLLAAENERIARRNARRGYGY